MLELIANTFLITERPCFEHNTETNKYSMKEHKLYKYQNFLIFLLP